MGVTCPCTFCKSQPDEAILKELIDEELYAKLERFRTREKVLNDGVRFAKGAASFGK